MNSSPQRRRGFLMIVLGWALAFFVITAFYRMLHEQQYNPNRLSVIAEQDGELILEKNRQGHYIVEGTINDEYVVFLIDTGATRVAVAESTASALGLTKGAPRPVRTANGETIAWQTTIDELQIGFMLFKNLSGVIIPDLDEDTVLLGMNALEQLHITQSAGTLKLRPITNTQ